MVILLFLIIFPLETNGQDEELKSGSVIERELKSGSDTSREEGGGGQGGGEEGGEGEGAGERVGEAEKGTGTGTGTVVGVGVVIEGVQEGEWDEDKWSVSESEYKKYVKDSDIEDYLRGEGGRQYSRHVIFS